MKKFFLPEYFHLYDMNDEYICLLNAITLDVIYLNKNEMRMNNSDIFISDMLWDALNEKDMIHDESMAQDVIDNSIEKTRNRINDNTIQFLYIVLTVQCNLRCTYCHIQNGKNHENKVVMSRETLIRGLDAFKCYGGFNKNNSEIMFYGGEPFLASDLLIESIDIIRHYSKTIKITIFTNGTLVTEEIANKLKQYNVYVIVSIDGKESSHNMARHYIGGGGSFSETIRGYKFLFKAGVSVGISLVAGSHNIDSLVDEVEFISECLKPLDIGISTLHLFPGKDNPNEVPIDDVTKKMQEIQLLMRRKGMYVEHLFRRIRPFIDKSKRIYDCPSCNSKLLITPWDTIGFCEAFMEEDKYYYPISSFNLYECDERKEWELRVPLMNKECYSCPAISICGGGCPYDAFCESGSICNKDTRRCKQSIDMIEWLCSDLFDVLCDECIIRHQIIYEPSVADRQLLYGNVSIDDNLPLQNYSTNNEH